MTDEERRQQPRWKDGDRVMVECVAARVQPNGATNWPLRVVLDTGASKTIDKGGCVHYSAIVERAMRWTRVEDLPFAPAGSHWSRDENWRGLRLGRMYLVRTNGAEWRDSDTLLVPAPMLMIWLEKMALGQMVRGTPTHVCEVVDLT